MNRNSERNRPTPAAPGSSAPGQSSGSSMLASSVIGVPSRVMAGVFFSLSSFLRAFSSAAWRARYCSSTSGLGLAITTPASPSMMTQSSCSISCEACDMPTAAGMSRLRATIAVCEFWPPTSVTKPMKRAVAELQHVGRRNVMRDDDHLRLVFVGRQRAPAPAARSPSAP